MTLYNVHRKCVQSEPTLHYRRIRGDTIETYKIVTGKYQPCVAPTFHKGNVFVTRGNDLRLKKS